jgi:hypothetical protein
VVAATSREPTTRTGTEHLPHAPGGPASSLAGHSSIMKEERPMKKTTRKLRLNRETLQQLIDDPLLKGAPAGATVPVTACYMYTCPPICTQARPCAG